MLFYSVPITNGFIKLSVVEFHLCKAFYERLLGMQCTSFTAMLNGLHEKCYVCIVMCSVQGLHAITHTFESHTHKHTMYSSWGYGSHSAFPIWNMCRTCCRMGAVDDPTRSFHFASSVRFSASPPSPLFAVRFVFLGEMEGFSLFLSRLVLHNIIIAIKSPWRPFGLGNLWKTSTSHSFHSLYIRNHIILIDLQNACVVEWKHINYILVCSLFIYCIQLT